MRKMFAAHAFISDTIDCAPPTFPPLQNKARYYLEMDTHIAGVSVRDIRQPAREQIDCPEETERRPKVQGPTIATTETHPRTHPRQQETLIF